MFNKIFNFKFKIHNSNKGMTYVELIVVLGIFSMLSAVAIFNYGSFQSRVDIENLASDIALKIVEAQKSSVSGVLPIQGGYIGGWKPSYGVYFNPTSDGTIFTYFADLDQDGIFNDPDCSVVGECLDKISITKGNSIATLGVVYQGDEAVNCLDDLTIFFQRPDSSAILVSGRDTLSSTDVSYVQITIASPSETASNIKIYPSGRIQIDSTGSLLRCNVRGRL